MKCKNCSWSWEIEKEDKDPYLCHKCGYDSKLNDFDMVSLDKWKKQNEHPFVDTLKEGFVERIFSENVDEIELMWHRDGEDREVEVIGETDWMIQIDNELPKVLEGKIHIPEGVYHRVIKGSGDLKIKIIK